MKRVAPACPLILLAALMGGIAPTAWAQDAASAAAASADAPSTLGTVIVTGTRAQRRTVADSESPIDVLGARELRSTGSSELASVLGTLLPSFNFPRPSGADASDAVRPAQLRGLSPDQVLVLIDGKRRHTSSVVNVNGTQGRGSAPVDLNAIPIDAIDHIEVLRDGASAQYGSDAIAGVINIILKKGAKGGVAHVDVGQTDKGDGFSNTEATNFGLGFGDAGWLRLSLEHRKQNHTNRSGPYLVNSSDPRYGQVTYREGDPDSNANSLFVNGQYALTQAIDFYTYASHAERVTDAAANWRASTVLPSLYPTGFLPIEHSRSTDDQIVAGVRGDSDGWHWDASLNHGQNEFNLGIDGTANTTLGAASPTSFHLGKLKNQQTLLNLDVSREVDLGLVSPATVSFGAEGRHESYRVSAGDPASYDSSGAQGFSGFQPSNATSTSRNSEAIYAGLEAPITRQFSASAALRGEHYSDFGSATSAKLSARYAPIEAVAFRATASTGFRAPSLAQQNYTITTTNNIVVNNVNTPVQTGTFPVGSAAAGALGATPLKAEKSRNFSLGVTLQPTREWTTSIDLYQIDIDHRILFSGNLVLPTALQNQLLAQGVQVGAARYFTNAVDTRTRGLDLVSSYRLDLGNRGRFDFNAGFNRNYNKVRSVAANPAVLSANGLTLIDRQTLGRATVASPGNKLNLGADYAWQAWTAHADTTRYGAFTVPQNNVALDQRFDPAWVLNLNGSVTVRKDWRVTLGLDNATNRYPDRVTALGNLNTGGNLPYSPFSPFGFNGRYYYAKLAYNW